MADPNRMAIEAIREHYDQAVARADMLDQLRAVAVERANNESTRAEAAEAELRELRKLVDAWKAADRMLNDAPFSQSTYDAERVSREALRHA